MNETPETILITLNWNTTALCRAMVESIEHTTPEPHRWIVLDNGSRPEELDGLYTLARDVFGACNVFSDKREGWGAPHVGAAILRVPENLGCVRGHNLAFDFAAALAHGRPYDLVMIDTDVEVNEAGWLSRVRDWIEGRPIGIIGLEHAFDEVCAGAVFLDPSGNWYIHGGQTSHADPVQAESVGLGFALLRWPVPQLRFDTGYQIYYKQDDDLCFQVRAALDLEVWAYPVDCVHWGSGSLKANDYNVREHRGWDAFHEIKCANQRYFAEKWAWALRGRRPNLAAEATHLAEMQQAMAERRAEQGLSEPEVRCLEW